MQKYKVVWKTYGNPEMEFTTDDLSKISFNMLEAEFDTSDFDIGVELQEYKDFLNIFSGHTANVIVDINVPLFYLQDTFNFVIGGAVNFNIGDFITIDSEIVKVVNIQGSVITAERNNYFNTRKEAHVILPGKNIPLIVEGHATPIGIEGDIYDEDDNKIMTCYITSLQSSGDAIYISVSNIINKYQKDTYIRKIGRDGDIILYSVTSHSAAQILKLFFDGIIEFSGSFMKFCKDIYFVESEEYPDYIELNPMDTLMQLLKYSNSFLDSGINGIAKVIRVIPFSSFSETPQDFNIYDEMNMEGGYTSSLGNFACNLDFKSKRYEAGEIQSLELKLKASIGYMENTISDNIIEIDLSNLRDDVEDPTHPELNEILFLRGLIFGDITFHSVRNPNVQVGKYYNMVGLGNNQEIVSFIPSSTAYNIKGFCYNVTEEEVKFILIDATLSHPVSPSLYVKAISANEVIFQGATVDMEDYLNTDFNKTLMNAQNSDYGYFFYGFNSVLRFYEIQNYTPVGAQVQVGFNSSNNTFEFTTPHNLTIGKSYIMAYADADQNYNNHLRAKGGIV
jgi:hypothetical protein